MPDTQRLPALAVSDQPTEVSRWQRIAGVLIGTIAVLGGLSALILLVWGFVEGSPSPQGRIRPAVFDDAGILSPEAIRAIEQTTFPPDVPVIVRTVDAPAATIVGAAATERMERETHWQSVRPRTWYQNKVKRNHSWGTGVYVLVSKNPALVQVRFGDGIRLQSYRTGLAAGPEYRRVQQAYAAAPIDARLVALVAELSRRLPSVLPSGWLRSIPQRLASIAFAEIEEFVLPAEGAFRQGAVRMYVGFSQRLGASSSGWRFLAFTGFCYCVIWSAAYLVSRSLGKRFKAAGAIAGGILSLLAKAVYLVAAIGSLLLFANGRVEDELLLRDLGLQQSLWIGFDGPYFSATGGWLLCIATASIAFLSSLLETMEGIQEGLARGETNINLGFLIAPFAWGALVVLLPRALGFFALFNRFAAIGGSLMRIVRS